MKTTTLKTFGTGIAVVALMLGLATSARASLVIQQVSDPVFTGSWSVDFTASGVTFDKIIGTIVSGGSFEIPGLTATGWTQSGNASVASISGPATGFLLYTANFTGLPTDIPPVTLDFSVWYQNNVVGETLLQWNPNGRGGIGEFDVPEPTTIIAGALLLLPFGASTLRILRKRQTA
jgi:hypothetical protein